jgi:hypothetical protein
VQPAFSRAFHNGYSAFSKVFLSQVLFIVPFENKKVTTKDQISHISAGHAFQDLPIPSERRRTMNMCTAVSTK